MKASATGPSGPSIRVVLVEDDVHFQNAVARSIEASGDITLVNLARTRAEGLRALRQVQADVLLVDLGLPDGSGIDVISAARTRWPGCSVMVCTAFGDEAHVMQAIEAGAAGYLLKDSTPEKMLNEIRSLCAGGSPISPLIARLILTRFRGNGTAAKASEALSQAPASPADAAGQPAQAALSQREQEVLEFITKGFSAADIAGIMQVSHHTVLSYVRRIYGKLNVSSRTEAIHEARRQGILGP